MSYTILWGENVKPWELALPWQYNTYAYFIETSILEFIITNFTSDLIKSLNILTEKAEYVITGFETIFTKVCIMLITKAEYTITGFNVFFNRAIHLFTKINKVIINYYNVAISGFGNWVWTNTSKPSSDWTNSSKPSSDWTNKNKYE